MKTVQGILKPLLFFLILASPSGLAHPQGTADIGLPKITKDDEIIVHDFYTLSYDERHEQARWVAYELTRKEVEGTTPRPKKDPFRANPNVPTGSAELLDYKGSGYDRGHLAPAADMKMSARSMDDSFFMDNISPQVPSFNRDIWKKLEQLVRRFALRDGAVFIVTGPVLNKNDFKSIGANKVSVPEYFYKVVLDYTEPDIKAIGFILPNQKSRKPLSFFAVTVDDVERTTGIDFYPALPDRMEKTLESSLDLKAWGLE